MSCYPCQQHSRFDMTSGSGGLHRWCFSLASVFPVTLSKQLFLSQSTVMHSTSVCISLPCMANSIIFVNVTYIQWKDIHIYLSSPRFGSLSSSVINDEAPLDPTGLKSILARSLERWNNVMNIYLQPLNSHCGFAVLCIKTITQYIRKQR